MQKKTKIIIFLGILSIVLIVLVIILNNKQEVVENERTDKELRQKAVVEYYSDKIMPQNVSSLYGKYKGKNDKNDLYKSINKMINYLPQINLDLQNINKDEIEKYFSDNASIIKDSFGISNLEEFIKLTTYLKQFNIGENNYKYCSIVSDSYETIESEDYDEYLTFNLNIVYENIETLTLKVYFANSTVARPKIKFLPQ